MIGIDFKLTLALVLIQNTIPALLGDLEVKIVDLEFCVQDFGKSLSKI